MMKPKKHCNSFTKRVFTYIQDITYIVHFQNNAIFKKFRQVSIFVYSYVSNYSQEDSLQEGSGV